MKKVVACTTLVVALLAIADWIDPVREGLNAHLLRQRDLVGSAGRPPSIRSRPTIVWSPPGTGGRRAQFSTTWAGSFLAMHDGPYALATISDDGSCGVCGWPDRGRQRRPPRLAARRDRRGDAEPRRARDLRPVSRRTAGGAPFHFELLWARAGQPLERMPGMGADAAPRQLLGLRAQRRAEAGARRRGMGLGRLDRGCWALMVGVVVDPREGRRGSSANRSGPRSDGSWPARWSLNAIGIWWGLPGGSWAPDELTPTLVLGAAARWFANGWFDRYPPFHYYVLTAAFSPMLLLERWGVSISTCEAPYALHGADRPADQPRRRHRHVARDLRLRRADASAGAPACWPRRCSRSSRRSSTTRRPPTSTCRICSGSRSRWSSTCALLDGLTLRDFVGFAACGMLAICTKDQAYGLYLLTPFAIVERIWRRQSRGGRARIR